MNDLWGLRERIMHGESEGVCVRRSIGLLVSPFVIGDGFCGLCKVVIVIESPEDGLWIIHGVPGGGLYFSCAEIQNVWLVMQSKSLRKQEFKPIF